MRIRKCAAKYAAILSVLCAVVLFPGVAKASDGPEEPHIPEKSTYYVTSEQISHNWMLPGVKAAKYVTKLKSSNKKVAAVDKFEYNGTVYVGVTPKKAGKTTISFTAKVNGSKKKYKCTAIVKNYKTPFSSFKIGSTNIAKKLKKSNSVSITLKKTQKKQKVSFKLKSGWQLGWAGYYNSKDGQNYVVLKSGKKITLKKNRQIQMSLIDKDGGSMDIFVYYR